MRLPLEFIEPASCVPSAVADWLYSGLFPQKTGDISLVLLPTRSAARTVKSMLLRKAQRHGYSGMAGAVFITPGMFMASLASGLKFAGPYRSFCAWKSVLANCEQDSGDYSPALPKSDGDIFGFVSELNSLMSDLSESGLDIASAAKFFAGGFDSEKWRRLAEMESSYMRFLGDYIPKEKAFDFVDCKSAFQRVYGENARIFLAGLSDPSPLLVRILDSLEGVDVKIGVVALESWRDCFDSWGRPTDAWIGKNIELDSADILPVADICMQAEALSDLILSYGSNPSGIVAVCCNEPDSSSAIMASFRSSKVDAYLPSGTSLADAPLMRLLSLLRKFWEDASFESAANIMRNPLVLAMLERLTGASADDILLECDSFFDSRLPDTFASALNNADGLAFDIFSYLNSLIDCSHVEAGRYFENFISMLFPEQPGIKPDSSAFVELKFFREQISEIFAVRDLNIGVLDAACVILQIAQGQSIPPDKNLESMPLLDWMEAFWTPQEHLVLCDFNEGIVPQNPPSPIRPNSQRAVLGMRDSKSRRARDAHMLAALAHSRNSSGRLSIIVPARRGDASPAAASCLLFQCPDQALAPRVKALFSWGVDSRKNLPFGPSWTLKLPVIELGDVISVSALKAYMECPFRFYLSRVMRLRTFDENAVELSPDKIGNIVHSTLEAFGRTSLKDSADSNAVEKSLVGIMDSEIMRMYGPDFPAALSLQFYSLKKIFGYAARKLAKLKEEGWKTVSTERSLDSLEIGGFKISMRVDRIDENPKGDLLVIDYKTKTSFEPARAAHLRRRRGSAEEWVDLQLPLYKAALSELYPGRRIICAHFVLCPSEDDTRFSFWDISDAEIDSAMKRAGELCSEIRARKFEPSAKSPRWDPYSTMFSFAGGNLKDYVEFADA